MTATGGIMIVAIGLNMIGLTKIRVANLLPGILVVAIVVAIVVPFSFGAFAKQVEVHVTITLPISYGKLKS